MHGIYMIAFVVYVSVSIHLLQDSDPITSSIDYRCTTAGTYHTYLLNMKVKIIYRLLYTYLNYCRVFTSCLNFMFALDVVVDYELFSFYESSNVLPIYSNLKHA